MDLEVLGLDFESYWEPSYTLKTTATSEYVRDPRFKAHGAALRFRGTTWWVTHDDLPTALAALPWDKLALLCHNTAFDGFVLSQRYGHIPAYYLDTLSMSRGAFGVHVDHGLEAVAHRLGLGSKIPEVLESTRGIRDLSPEQEAKLAEYAKQDVELLWGIWEQLNASYPLDELDTIDLTIRAFCDPRLLVDPAILRQAHDEEIAERTTVVERSGADLDQLRSRPQFAELLRARGVEPPVKTSPRTGKQTYAFAKADLAFQALEHDPRVADLIAARLAATSSIIETRANTLLLHGDPGPLPIMMNYCQAHSMRWTGGDRMNPQNLNRGSLLRKGIIAPPGHRLVIVDSAQIEARTLAWLAGQTDLLDIFRTGGDPYIAMAERIVGHVVEKGTKERQLGKTAVLGLGYNMAWEKFAYTVRAGLIAPAMEISDETAQRAVETYRAANTKITKLWEIFQDKLAEMVCGNSSSFHDGLLEFEPDRVWMPNGLALHFPGLTAKRSGRRLYDFSYEGRNGTTHIYGGKLVGNTIQCLARIIVAWQVLQIAKRYHTALLVHDEGMFLVKEEEANDALRYALECFSTPPAWCKDLPVAAEGGISTYYAKF